MLNKRAQVSDALVFAVVTIIVLFIMVVAITILSLAFTSRTLGYDTDDDLLITNTILAYLYSGNVYAEIKTGTLSSQNHGGLRDILIYFYGGEFQNLKGNSWIEILNKGETPAHFFVTVSRRQVGISKGKFFKGEINLNPEKELGVFLANN